MRTTVLAAFASFLFFLSPVAADSSGRLDDTAIRTLVVGKTFLGTYQDGLPWRETYFIDEGLDYQDPDYRITGIWYAADNALCTFYDDVEDFQGGCFAVFRRSANCVDFYAVDQSTNRPLATAEEIASGVNWTARGWRSDHGSTCPEGLTS